MNPPYNLVTVNATVLLFFSHLPLIFFPIASIIQAFSFLWLHQASSSFLFLFLFRRSCLCIHSFYSYPYCVVMWLFYCVGIVLILHLDHYIIDVWSTFLSCQSPQLSSKHFSLSCSLRLTYFIRHCHSVS